MTYGQITITQQEAAQLEILKQAGMQVQLRECPICKCGMLILVAGDSEIGWTECGKVFAQNNESVPRVEVWDFTLAPKI